MKTKEEVHEFLREMEYQRISKSLLQSKLQAFFETENKLEDATDPDCKELDYSFIFTNGDSNSTQGFIDIEIWYLKTRERGGLFITGYELLEYQY